MRLPRTRLPRAGLNPPLLAFLVTAVAASVLITSHGHDRSPSAPRVLHPARHSWTRPPGWPRDLHPITHPATVPAYHL